MALSAACHGPERPKPVGTPGRTGTASVEGVVTRTRAVPPLQAALRGAFAECPPAPPRPEPVAGGRVAEAFVHVAEGLPPGDYPMPKEPVVLDRAATPSRRGASGWGAPPPMST